MPPSGAKTSSFAAIALAPPAGNGFDAAPIECEHVARRYFFDVTAGELKNEPAGRVEADKAAALFAAAVADGNLLADAARGGEPVVENNWEARAAAPLLEAPAHRGGEL